MSDTAELLFANEAFYHVFRSRDLAAMEALWARRAPIACVHPGWQALITREAVMASWSDILSNPKVQVLVDHYDEDWQRLGYVQLRGKAELLQRGAEYRQAIRLLEGKYHQYKKLPLEGRPVIKIVVERTVTWCAPI